MAQWASAFRDSPRSADGCRRRSETEVESKQDLSDVKNSTASSSYYLERKKIPTLILSSCNGGDTSKSENMATAFISWGTIGEVYAWNGTASFVGAGTVLFCDYTIEFSPDAIGEWYFDTVITIGSVMLYSIIGDRSGIVSSIITYVDDLKRISEIGRVRYFINSEGRIEYEKVPNGSWTFALAMYSS